jgi:hypothetical protein
MGVYGYDMVIRLGSNIDFTGMSAEIINTQEIEIVRQNFGFELPNGITSVTLDMNVEHYYIEVRGAPQSGG